MSSRGPFTYDDVRGLGAVDAVAASPENGAPSVKCDLLLLRRSAQPDGHVVRPAHQQRQDHMQQHKGRT